MLTSVVWLDQTTQPFARITIEEGYPHQMRRFVASSICMETGRRGIESPAIVIAELVQIPEEPQLIESDSRLALVSSNLPRFQSRFQSR